MAWATTNTHGLLDRWQIRFLQELYSFHQVRAGYETFSPDVWVQSERNELAANIALAFEDAKRWLGYYPRPVYRNYTVQLDAYHDWQNQVLQIADSAYIQAFGTRGTELIEGNITVTYSNVSGGNLLDTATITVTTDEITDGEPALFFRVADGAAVAADERYQLTPNNITYNGSAYVFTLPRARLVTPNAQAVELIDGDPQQRNKLAVGNASTAFASAVDCYRVYTDTTTQAQLISAPINAETTQTRTAVQAFSVSPKDSTFILRRKSDYPSRDPYAVSVNVLIGKRLTAAGTMEPQLEEAILRVATANLPLNVEIVKYRTSTQWQYDRVLASDPQQGIGLTSNPLGARNVDVAAARIYFNNAIGSRGMISDLRLWG